MEADSELAASLTAAAHLIHGSSEGRFEITYCTADKGLTSSDIEAVGYRSRRLDSEAAHLGVDAETPEGSRHDVDGASFYFIANPGLGLWATGSFER